MLMLNDQLKHHLESWNQDDTNPPCTCTTAEMTPTTTTSCSSRSCPYGGVNLHHCTRKDDDDGIVNEDSSVTDGLETSDDTPSTTRTGSITTTKIPVVPTTAMAMDTTNKSIETGTRTSIAASAMTTSCNCCCHRTNNDSKNNHSPFPGIPVLVMTFGLGMWCRDCFTWSASTVTTMTIMQGVVLLLASLAAVLLPILPYWRMHPKQWYSTPKRSTSLQRQYREELTCLLASIGAPPIVLLLQQLPQVPHGNKNKDYGSVKDGKVDLPIAPTTTITDVVLQESIDLVKCFREFLWTVDKIMERFQSATSMKLGLGIWSPAVNRMELNRRQWHHDMWGGNRKQILARVLLSCLAALQHNDEEDDNDNQYGGVGVVVVTLSWLQSTRHRLVEALSDYFSALDTTAIQELQQSRETIEQLQTYLCAAMDGPFSGGTDEQQLHRETEDSPQSSPLDPVAQHLHAAEIALWAYAQETTRTPTRTTREDNNNCNIKDDEPIAFGAAKREWVQRFYALIKVAQSLHDETCNSMDADGRAKDQQNNKAVMLSSSHSSEMSSNTASLSFEHHGISNSKILELKQSDPNIPSDATLVFSGRGCIQRKRQLRSVASSPTSSGVANAPVAATNKAMTQVMLIQELRTRLAAMDKGNEVDVTTTTCTAAAEVPLDATIDDDVPITILPEHDGTPLSMPNFMLSELQSCIRVQVQEEAVQSFGD